MKKSFTGISTVLALMAFSGCASSSGCPDMGPIGFGLKFIGICLVVTALVFVLGGSRRH